MRAVKPAVVLASALALTGCLASQTVVKVKKDGSGTIEQTTTMSAEAAAMFSGLATSLGKEMGAKETTPPPTPDLFSEADMKAAATKLGQGVTFVSSEAIKTADRVGRRAVYAFTDVNKLTIDQKPNAPSGGGPGGTPGGDEKREFMALQFAKLPGGTLLLTVRSPEPDFDADKKAKEAAAASKPTTAEEQQALQMMKQMFKGLKIGIDVEVDGQIVKTNSPYVAGNRVTLLEMDFEQILSDPKRMDQLQNIKTIEEAKLALKDVKGFKVNLEREVKIEFR